MKILHVINAYSPVFGCGPADRCQKMASFLAGQGHSVTVFTSNHSWDSVYAESTPDVEVVSFPYVGGRFCYTPSMSREIRKRIKEFDIVHLMNHWTYQNIAAFAAARKEGIPIVFSAMGALPIVYRSFLIKRIYNYLFGYRILRDADALIGITSEECNQYIPYNPTGEKIHYLPNAIDGGEYFKDVPSGNFRGKFKIPKDKKVILFLGRLSHIKGPDLLLDGYIGKTELQSKAVLVFVGPDYDMEAFLKQKAMESGLDENIFFCGPLTGEDKLEAYKDADVFVVPSRQENMSIVAVEACALKTPVVITDVCGFDDIGKYNAGILVPVDAVQIIDAVSRIVMDKSVSETMSENAAGMVEMKYTWEKVGEKLERILKDLMGLGIRFG